MCTVFATGCLFLAGIAAQLPPARTADTALVRKWEYRVLTKEQLPTGQASELAAALNKLGDDGWELVTTGSNYIFKRPKPENRVSLVESEVHLLAAEVDALRDRVSWSKRMTRKGFLSENQLRLEEDSLATAQAALDKAKAELKSLTTEGDKAKRDPQK